MANVQKFQKDQAGSALVTVLVAIAFIIILGSVILAVSVVNVKTKAVDYQAKKDFYENEVFLDDIYNGIGQSATVCLDEAYSSVLSSINDIMAANASEEEVYHEFCRQFVTKLSSSFNSGDLTACKTLLNKYATSYDSVSSNPVEVTGLGSVEIVYSDAPTNTIPTQFIFKDLEIKYSNITSAGDGTGYENTIITDIVIDMPYLTFFDEPDYLLDYAMAANEGVFIRGYYTGGVVGGNRVNITGNLYAGTSITADDLVYCEQNVYGGLNLYRANVTLDGNYIVSKGDVNVRKSTLNINAKRANLWAETLRTIQEDSNLATYDQLSEYATIINLGKTFLANDLELNSYNSNVSFGSEGEFYAYNNGTFLTQEKSNVGSSSVHTSSSSVIINERSATLDFSLLDTLIISGKAYMDLGSNGVVSTSNSEIETGESLAIRTNQYMYMVPDEFLTVANPVTVTEANAAGINLATVIPWPDMTWFAAGMLDTAMPIRIEQVSQNGIYYYYFFLNFTTGNEENYAATVLSADITKAKDASLTVAERLKWQWCLGEKARLQDKANNMDFEGVSVDGTGSSRIYGEGVLTKVDVATDLLSAFENTSANLGTDYAGIISEPLYKRYVSLYYYLDPQENIALSSTAVVDKSGGAGIVGLPLSDYIDFDLMTANALSAGVVTTYTTNPYTTLLKDGDITINTNTQGIVICTGDVTIEAGVSVEGIVIAGGKIYVKGSTVETSILNNRAIVQAIIDEEMTIESEKPAGSPDTIEYALTYLKKYTVTKTGKTIEEQKSITTDYVDFISYQNWRKG